MRHTSCQNTNQTGNMILKAHAFLQRHPLPPDFVPAPSHGAVFFLLPLSFSVIPALLLLSSLFSPSVIPDLIRDPGSLLFPFFVFVPAADAANGQRHEMAPLHKRGKSYPRDPIAPPHGAWGRGCAPVPNPRKTLPPLSSSTLVIEDPVSFLFLSL